MRFLNVGQSQRTIERANIAREGKLWIGGAIESLAIVTPLKATHALLDSLSYAFVFAQGGLAGERSEF